MGRSRNRGSCGTPARRSGSAPIARGRRDSPSDRTATPQWPPPRDPSRRLSRGSRSAAPARSGTGGAARMRRKISPEPPKRRESLELAALSSLGPGLGDGSAGTERGSDWDTDPSGKSSAPGHPQASRAQIDEPTTNDRRSLPLLNEEELESLVAEAEFRRLASVSELRAQL